MPPIERILCPVDFSPGSDRALEYAASLAEKLRAQLHILHVYQIPVYALPDGALLPGPEFSARLTDDVQNALRDLKERLGSLEPTTHMVEGIPHNQITKCAEDFGAQLIVMGTHGRTGLERFLVGSVAERVVRTSKVPVITVPLKDNEDK